MLKQLLLTKSGSLTQQGNNHLIHFCCFQSSLLPNFVMESLGHGHVLDPFLTDHFAPSPTSRMILQHQTITNMLFIVLFFRTSFVVAAKTVARFDDDDDDVLAGVWLAGWRLCLLWPAGPCAMTGRNAKIDKYFTAFRK
jgi:hypothetical protein